MFPILWGYDRDKVIKKLQLAGVPYMPVCMPWDMLAPHEGQARSNHGQTLARLAERGGLGPDEVLAILDGYSVFSRRIPVEKACHDLCQRIAAWVSEEVELMKAEPQTTTTAVEPSREHLLKAGDALVRCISIAGGKEPSYALVADWLYRMAERQELANHGR
jgi:hypothetical protein